MIISDQFWPQLKDEELNVPEEVKDHLKVYTKGYEALKVNYNHQFIHSLLPSEFDRGHYHQLRLFD